MAELNLHFVDELIGVRQEQHGGGRGAPALVQAGIRQGASINRSCIVMVSALLQTYVEDVFKICAQKALPPLANEQLFSDYWKQLNRWGNPSAHNIKMLFLRLGIENVFDGLSWTKCNTPSIISKLNELNEIRNDIAHGSMQIRVNNVPYSLTLVRAKAFRNFADQFGKRFEPHALALL